MQNDECCRETTDASRRDRRKERRRERELVLNDINRLGLILKKRPTSCKVKKADLWENWPTQVVSEDCRFVDICCYQ